MESAMEERCAEEGGRRRKMMIEEVERMEDANKHGSPK